MTRFSDVLPHRSALMFGLLLASLLLGSARPAVGQEVGPSAKELVWAYEISDPGEFIRQHSGQSVEEALASYIKADQRQFLFVATRGAGYVKEFEENDSAFREKIEEAAARITEAAQAPVVHDTYKERMSEVGRRVREEMAGAVSFTTTNIHGDHIGVSSKPPEKSEAGDEKPTPPKIKKKIAEETPTYSSVKGQWLLYLGAIGALMAVLVVGGCIEYARRQKKQQVQADQETQRKKDAATRERVRRGRDQVGKTGSEKAEEASSTWGVDDAGSPSGSSTSGNASGWGDETSRKGGDSWSNASPSCKGRRRRRSSALAGVLLAGSILLAGLASPAPAQANPGHAERPAHVEALASKKTSALDKDPTLDEAPAPDEVVVLDASGSNYPRSLADARTWLTEAISRGRSARVIAFGDSTWVAAAHVDSLDEIDDALDGIPEQSLTRLADAMRFVDAQMRAFREQGTRPQVRLTSDFESDDSGNEAMAYLSFAGPDSASAPVDTASAPADSTAAPATASAGSEGGFPLWLWGLSFALLVTVPLLIVCWRVARRRGAAERENAQLDRVALWVSEPRQRTSYTVRELLVHGTLSLQDDELLLTTREEGGRYSLMLGLEGTDPKEDPARAPHAESASPADSSSLSKKETTPDAGQERSSLWSQNGKRPVPRRQPPRSS